jgi:hypothetical protein
LAAAACVRESAWAVMVSAANTTAQNEVFNETGKVATPN